MPEGPEVRREQEKLEAMVHGVVESAKVLSGRYMKTPIDGLQTIVGRKVKNVQRYGKLLVIHLDEDISILSTMGMSGHWFEGDPKVRNARIQLVVGGRSFVFVDQRNFGTFKVVEFSESIDKMLTLGVDIFRRDQDVLDSLERLITKYGADEPILEVLMDQRVFAGVGNYIRAEALYKCRLDPFTIAGEMTRQQLEQLWKSIREVADEAYEKQSAYKDLCYRRDVADCGRIVHSFKGRNDRVLWYVKW